MNKDIVDTLIEAVRFEKLGEFRIALDKYKEIIEIENENVDALFKIGEMHHQLGELPAAMSAYFHVLDVDPDHKKAKVKMEMIKSIMDYFNPDLYNP